MTRRLFCSFSGGETSGLLTRRILTDWRERYDEVVVVFANTGQENEQTLEFVRDCDLNFGFGTVWVEAVVHHGQRKLSGHKVVDFAAASRAGGPFEAVIQKYGIPNTKFPHCTRELKMRPMQSYMRAIGWAPGTYDTAVGIRADEPARRSPSAAEARIVYPLMDWAPTKKPDVNAFWRDQPFRLRLAGYQGNCRWCWKKSERKRLTIMDDDPSAFDFPARMERTYGKVGPEFLKTPPPPDTYRRTFFRGGKSVCDLLALYQDFDPRRRAGNDADVYDDFDPDADGGCSESCEVDWSRPAPDEDIFA